MNENLLPAVAPVVEEPPPVVSPEKVKALGVKLSKDFVDYERDRRPAEQKWVKNLRQYLGIYDPEVLKDIPSDRSKAYPKLTRVKCVSMVSRLMNLLFPSSEKNWGVEPSPVPNLSLDDLNFVLTELQKDPQAEVTDEVITAAVRDFAKTRAKNLEVEIEDQLSEIGGAKMVSYIALCRKVLMSGVLYGMGVLKGPMAKSRSQRRWRLGDDERTVVAVDETILVPMYEFVPIWDYYPDMSAKYLHQMDGQFQRIVMSRAQVRRLADNSEFDEAAIKGYLNTHKDGNFKRKQFETELKALGVEATTPVTDGRKYEVVLWDGGLSGHYLNGCGIRIPEDKMHEMYSCVVWMIDDVVIRTTLSPWAMLNEDNPPPSYHHFIFEEDETTVVGNGLPTIMRDSALGVAATARMTLDNAGVVCGPQLEVNTSLLKTNADVTGVSAYKVWERDDESPATAGFRAVNAIQIDSHIPELLSVNELFRNFADQETFVNPATGGDMQKGPSEPFRTAAGASMIRGEAALPFKDVVRNFDAFTESVIGGLVTFNKHFNGKPSIKGDFQSVAKGSTSLIAKEVRGMGYDELARSVTPGEALYVDWRYLLKERVAVRDMDPAVMVNDAEAKRREDAQAQAQTAQSNQAAEMMQAQIRKTLAEAVKNISQSDKNAAGAGAAIYNAVLAGLEKGVTPSEVADVRTGASLDIPDGVLTMKEMEHPTPPAPTAAKK